MNYEIKNALRPVKTRLRRNRLLRGAAAGLAAGLCAAALLQAVSFFVPVPDRGLQAAGIAAAVMLLTALGNVLRPVKDREAAEAADACGLKERAITALEEGDEPIRQLQQRDACDALEALDMKKIRPGSMKKQLFAAFGCAAVLGILLLIPSPQDSDAAAQKALNRILQEGREAIAQAAEEDEAGLDEEQKGELRKIAGELNRELNESRDAADALVALDKAEQRLEKLRKQTAGDAGLAMAGAAANTETDKAPGKENGESKKEDDGPPDAAERETAKDGSSGDTSAQTGAGQQGNGADGATPTAAQLQTLKALAALQNAVNPSSQSGMSAQGTTGAQGNRGSQSTESGTGRNGLSGGKKPGNGAGEGSTNEDQSGKQNGNHSGGNSQGTRDPRFREAKYETIYDPEHIDKDKQDVMTEQYRLGDEDSLQLEVGPGQGNLNGDVPWSEALHEYAETEARSAERENLTVRERQWVDEYYRLLTEQK